MLCISKLFEQVYDPAFVGTAKQVGGPGYATSELRTVKPPNSAVNAKQKQQQQVIERERKQNLITQRSKKNLTPQQRNQNSI